MDDRNPASELPDLYRTVLDALARLEATGDRAAAYELRQRAHRTYAAHWDERGLRTLQRLVREIDAKTAAVVRRSGGAAPMTSRELARTA